MKNSAPNVFNGVEGGKDEKSNPTKKNVEKEMAASP
jgi:hypothetical protein